MLVELADVSHRLGGRWVLARVSLAVPAGRAVLLTGDNGAGKTTLLRVVATAVRPRHGALRLFGSAVGAATAAGAGDGATAAARRRLRLMTHQHYFYEALGAAENLHIAHRLVACGPAPVAALLAEVGLSGVGDAPVRTFSAGMKRRLGLARLLLGAPELALLDEPFGQLDPRGVAMMEGAIAGLRGRGATVVLCTHDVARGRALCDWHVHLQAGRVVADGALA